MFGRFAIQHDSALRGGKLSVGEYAAELLSDLLNAASVVDHAQWAYSLALEDENDGVKEGTAAAFTGAVRALVDLANECRIQARRARVLMLDPTLAVGTDLDVTRAGERDDNLEHIAEGELVSWDRAEAEIEAARAVAARNARTAA